MKKIRSFVAVCLTLTCGWFAVAAESYNVTKGSVFEIESSDLTIELSDLAKKPSLELRIGEKSLRAIWIQESSREFKKDNPSKLTCVFKSNRIEPGKYELWLLGKDKEGDKIESKVTDDFNVEKPAISNVEQEESSSSDLLFKIIGQYFSTQNNLKVTVSFPDGDSTKTVKGKVQSIYFAKAYKHKKIKSFMDPVSGDSRLFFTTEEFDTTAGFTVTIQNNFGSASFTQEAAQRDSHTLELATSDAVQGSTSPKPANNYELSPGKPFSIKAIPEDDAYFVKWVVDGAATVANSEAIETTITLPKESTSESSVTTATATFAKKFKLILKCSPENAGLLSPFADEGTWCVPNEEVSISATAGFWGFEKWEFEGDASIADLNSSSTTITLKGDATATAFFSADIPAIRFAGLVAAYAQLNTDTNLQQGKLIWVPAVDSAGEVDACLYHVYVSAEDTLDKVFQAENLVATYKDTTNCLVDFPEGQEVLYCLVVAESPGGVQNSNHVVREIHKNSLSLKNNGYFAKDLATYTIESQSRNLKKATLKFHADVWEKIEHDTMIVADFDGEFPLMKVDSYYLDDENNTIVKLSSTNFDENVNYAELRDSLRAVPPSLIPEDDADSLRRKTLRSGNSLLAAKALRRQKNGEKVYFDPDTDLLISSPNGSSRLLKPWFEEKKYEFSTHSHFTLRGFGYIIFDSLLRKTSSYSADLTVDMVNSVSLIAEFNFDLRKNGETKVLNFQLYNGTLEHPIYSVASKFFKLPRILNLHYGIYGNFRVQSRKPIKVNAKLGFYSVDGIKFFASTNKMPYVRAKNSRRRFIKSLSYQFEDGVIDLYPRLNLATYASTYLYKGNYLNIIEETPIDSDFKVVSNPRFEFKRLDVRHENRLRVPYRFDFLDSQDTLQFTLFRQQRIYSLPELLVNENNLPSKEDKVERYAVDVVMIDGFHNRVKSYKASIDSVQRDGSTTRIGTAEFTMGDEKLGPIADTRKKSIWFHGQTAHYYNDPNEKNNFQRKYYPVYLGVGPLESGRYKITYEIKSYGFLGDLDTRVVEGNEFYVR